MHTPECCYQLPSFAQRDWLTTDLAQELQADALTPAATQTLTFQTNRPVLLGRLELEYLDTVIASSSDNQGLLVAGLPLFASQGGGDLACFKPNAPGLADANYVGVPLFPQQTAIVRASFTGGNSALTGRWLCRPLTEEEIDRVQSADPFVAGYRLLYGLPTTTIAPGTGQLVMTVERPIQAGFNLGLLVLSALSSVGKFDLLVTSITVAGVAVDQEVTPASVAHTHYSFTNARGRGLRLKSQLPTGSRVIVNVQNTTGAPIVVQGSFIRAPEFGSGLSGGVEAQRPLPLSSSAMMLPREGGAVMPGVTRSSYLSPTGRNVLAELQAKPGMLAGLDDDGAEDMAEAIAFLGSDKTAQGMVRQVAEGKLSPFRALGTFRTLARNRGVVLPSAARGGSRR